MKENNVIFEKDAIKKFSQQIKQYNKVFILTSPTPKEKFLPLISNLLKENNVTFWTYCLPKNATCTSENVLKACSFVKGASVVVALGAGTVADTAKIVSKKLSLPCVIVPTTITHFGIFSSCAVLCDAIPKIIETEKPTKVYLDERIINESPEQFITSTLCFSLGLLEHVFALETQSLIAGEQNVNLQEIKSKIKKIEELCGWLSLSNSFAILNLMDYVFDLSSLVSFKTENSALMLSNLINCSTLKHNFGEKYLLCSQVLLKCYSNFLKQKLILPKNIPEREKILQILSKKTDFFHVSTEIEEIFNRYILKTNYLLNQNLQFKIQTLRIKLVEKCLEKQVNISKFRGKLLALNSNSKRLRMIDENELFSSLEILPVFSSSLLPSLLSRYGYLNVV